MNSEPTIQKFREIRAKFPYIPAALRIVFGAARGWTIAWAAVLLIQGLLPTATIYLTRSTVNALVNGLKGGADWNNLAATFLPIGLLVAVMILAQLMQSAAEWVRTIQAELVQDHVMTLVHSKSTSLDLAFYDSPAFFDRLDRTRTDATMRPLALLENVGGLLQNGLTFITMSVVLLPYGWWLPPFLVLSTFPAFIVILKNNQRQHAWWKGTTALRRRTQYFDMVLTERWAAEELRLFGFASHFREGHRAVRSRLRTERLQILKQHTLSRIAAELLALVVAGGAMIWMILGALSGTATLGDVALFYQAFDRGQSVMRSLLSSLSQIYANMLYVETLFEFLAIDPKVLDPLHPEPAPKNLSHSIAFRNVTFRYPGSDRIALKNFNLEVPIGRTVAIVGPNGAGKTTLTKLLCRFYDPDEGSVEIDGKDIRRFALSDLRRLFSLLMQVHVTYQLTARENIALADLARQPTDEEITAAAKAAGAHDLITDLPQKYDTPLGTWFEGGTNLSGGEWQRVSTARAYLRKAEVIVLDEPTSFMDSWAEADWFKRLREHAAGRTTIIITHRFTIAMRADIIHVMDQGQIVESGCHEELLHLGGLYAQSWAVQMQAAASPTRIPTIA